MRQNIFHKPLILLGTNNIKFLAYAINLPIRIVQQNDRDRIKIRTACTVKFRVDKNAFFMLISNLYGKYRLYNESSILSRGLHFNALLQK